MGTKVGLFFSVDALIASALLVATMLLASDYYVQEAPTTHLSFQAQDLASFMGVTTNRELRDVYSQSLMENGTISDNKLTIFEQMAFFYGNGQSGLLGNYTKNALDGYFPVGSSYGIYIENIPVYERNLTQSAYRSSARRVIGTTNGSLVQNPLYLGPYIIEVRVWR